MTERAEAIEAKVEAFVRDVVVPYVKDGRRDGHSPSDALVAEMRTACRRTS